MKRFISWIILPALYPAMWFITRLQVKGIYIHYTKKVFQEGFLYEFIKPIESVVVILFTGLLLWGTVSWISNSIEESDFGGRYLFFGIALIVLSIVLAVYNAGSPVNVYTSLASILPALGFLWNWRTLK